MEVNVVYACNIEPSICLSQRETWRWETNFTQLLYGDGEQWNQVTSGTLKATDMFMLLVLESQ